MELPTMRRVSGAVECRPDGVHHAGETLESRGLTMNAAPANAAMPFRRPLEFFDAWPSQRCASLIDSDSWRRLRELASCFVTPVQTLCFECGLAAGDARADLAFCVFPSAYCEVPFGELPIEAGSELAWARAREFLAVWAAGKNPLTFELPFVCVAFDLAPGAVRLPAPCMSLCVDSQFFARRMGIHLQAPLSGPELVGLTARAHDRLTGEGLRSGVAGTLERCVARDLNVEAKHVSLMLSRASTPLKVDVRLPLASLSEYLKRIDFSGKGGDIADAVTRLASPLSRIQLNLIVHPTQTAPRLEVELFAGEDPVGQESRGELLRRLVSLELCSPEKARNLLDISAQPAVADTSGRVLAAGWYTKVRFDESGACDAKVYLGLMPRLLAPGPRPSVAAATR
jgi:hypothetical protein